MGKVAAPTISTDSASSAVSKKETIRQDGHILDEESNYEHTAYVYSSSKKWRIVYVIMLCQISMNFNAAAFSSAKVGLEAWSSLSMATIGLGGSLFLIPYGAGCELWAPFSEEFGRRPIMQISLALVSLCALPCALAPNFWVILAFRILGGLCSAGGSVTLGIMPDLFEDGIERQQATLAVVWSSVAGSVVGPVVAGFQAQYLDWRWNFWMQLILGVTAWACHFFLVPETRSDVLLDERASYLRSLPEGHPERDVRALGPMEARGSLCQRLHWRKVLPLMGRPYKMLLTEPLVGCLSLLSGFADMLVYLSLDAFSYVLNPWGFSPVAKGLSFLPLLFSYFVCWLMYSCWYYRDESIKTKKREEPDNEMWDFTPERKLTLLSSLAITLPLGLALMALCTAGYHWGWHWIWLLAATVLIGLANFAIYAGSIDYMIQAYGSEYSASATGGNGFCRDVLAGLAAFWAQPFFHRIMKGSDFQLAMPQWILAILAAILVIPVFIFKIHGRWFRKKSHYASELASKREERSGVRQEAIDRAVSLHNASRRASLASGREKSLDRGRQHLTIFSDRAHWSSSRPQSRARSLPVSKPGSHSRSQMRRCGEIDPAQIDVDASIARLDTIESEAGLKGAFAAEVKT